MEDPAYNFNNNTGQGPIFKQLYFRQAFQELVDQEGVIDGPLHGYGKPTIGPVSAYPATHFLSPELAARRSVAAERPQCRDAAAKARLVGQRERDRHLHPCGGSTR